MDNIILLDALIENNPTDLSLFLQKIVCKASENKLLGVEIDGKSVDIKQTQELAKCTDVFLSYDDHSLIFKEVKKIEADRNLKHMPSDFKDFFDSIRLTSGNNYNRITFQIKNGKCEYQ